MRAFNIPFIACILTSLFYSSNFRKILEKPTPDSTYLFRSEIISDADSHKAYRTKIHGTPSHKRHRSRTHKERGVGSSTAETTLLQARQLSRLLVHDELEVVGLRKVLLQTSERLEQENRRAAEAETRAREAEARILALQAARHAAQADAQREQETLKAYQAQLEVARSEILRAQKELDNMAAEKERAEDEAARERSRARAIARDVEIQQALEKGREEGKVQGFVDGRDEGWQLGTQQGFKEAYREMMYYDNASVSSHSSATPPPLVVSSQPPGTSLRSTASRSSVPPPLSAPMAASDNISMNKPRATSTRSATSRTTRRRSESIALSAKSRIRVNSDPQPPSPIIGSQDTLGHRARRSLDRAEDISRPTSRRLSLSVSREQISPIPIQNRPSTPRHGPSSPLPGGYIPLQENGRVSLPPPHELDPPPPSPHTPTIPLPPTLGIDVPQTLQSLTPGGSAAPTITVQEPTPPEPSVTMPEPHPAPAQPNVVTESNVRPSKVLARDFVTRAESPPLPALPTSAGDRHNKGKQRQRMGLPRAGTGLHAPGRSSPSDTSTEFSQFEIVEQPERVRGVGMGRGNPSQLSVIMEGGSTAAESPEPERFPTPQQARNVPPPRREFPSDVPPSQGIINDPREYAEFSELPLSPTQLARRRVIADQLRHSPSGDNKNVARSIRDDVSAPTTACIQSFRQ